jgi:hypothetical protein
MITKACAFTACHSLSLHGIDAPLCGHCCASPHTTAAGMTGRSAIPQLETKHLMSYFLAARWFLYRVLKTRGRVTTAAATQMLLLSELLWTQKEWRGLRVKHGAGVEMQALQRSVCVSCVINLSRKMFLGVLLLIQQSHQMCVVLEV